jgi:hypothetical protein
VQESRLGTTEASQTGSSPMAGCPCQLVKHMFSERPRDRSAFAISEFGKLLKPILYRPTSDAHPASFPLVPRLGKETIMVSNPCIQCVPGWGSVLYTREGPSNDGLIHALRDSSRILTATPPTIYTMACGFLVYLKSHVGEYRTSMAFVQHARWQKCSTSRDEHKQ